MLQRHSMLGAVVAETILVFPAGLPDSLKYRAEAEARGATVIGSSSLGFDPAATAYRSWEPLPYVHEDGFGAALLEAIERRDIDAIYTPHEISSGVIAEVLEAGAPGVRLLARNPAMAQQAAYTQLHARALVQHADDLGLTGGRSPLSAIEWAGLVRLVDTIPGMSDLDKVASVISMMRHAVPGDIVEIGSWWGRSAALFVLLAQKWDIGAVLCVDPWQAENLDQGVDVLDKASARMDTDEAFRIFQINLSPIAGGRINFIRAPSAAAAARYGPALTVSSDTFGVTSYTGEIAVLHIDGNHTLEHAAADVAAWTPHVKPGGWIIVDDYVWAFGDGPRRAGDAYLEANAARIALSFVIGTALFIRLADA